MLEFLLSVLWILIFGGGIYYFVFGGKDKLAMYLYNKKTSAERAEMTFKNDFSPEYADAGFYMGNNYSRRYSQREWQAYYQEITAGFPDKNSPEYLEAVAPMVNAVVLDRHGYYLRRGVEDMSRKLVKFQAGVNDDLSLNYAIEPYKYYKNKVAQQPPVESTASSQSMPSDYALKRAEENYKRALRQSQRFKGTKMESVYAKNEKEAFAKLLSEQAKYGK